MEKVKGEIYYCILEEEECFIGDPLVPTVYTTYKEDWEESQCQSDYYKDNGDEDIIASYGLGESCDHTWNLSKIRVVDENGKPDYVSPDDNTMEAVKQKAEDMGLIYNKDFEDYIILCTRG